MNKTTKEVIVVFSHLPWDYPCDYVKQISLALTQKAEVVVIAPSSLPTLKNLLTDNKKRKIWISPFKDERIAYFPSLGIFPFQRFKLVENLNVWLNLTLFRFFYLLKFRLKKPIYWVFSYDFAKVISFFKWKKLLVYDRVDQVASLDSQEDQEMKEKDRCVLQTADFVFVNSPYSLKYVKRYNRQSFLTPWGCSAKLFFKRPLNLPREIKKIKRPRIGLVGHIDHRLSLRLLYSLATKKREWNFVFIGSIFDFSPKQSVLVRFHQWLEKVRELPNVYFLGAKPKETMPSFIAGLDVCLILYDTTQEFVRGCNPMKLYEYLAMGKPVVSTPIEAVEMYSPIVKIANDSTGFEKAIEAVLEKSDNKKEEEKRTQIAQENSWQEKVKKMWEKAKR